MKRRRLSAGGVGSPDSEQKPLAGGVEAAEFGGVKLEQLADGEEGDGGDGRLEGGYGAAGYDQMGAYEAAPATSASADLTGFLSSVAEQGG